jgi:hypothetical protein
VKVSAGMGLVLSTGEGICRQGVVCAGRGFVLSTGG